MERGFHLPRLDSIRFLAACWVAISHGAVPLKTLTDEPLLKAPLSAITASFNGLAAVMVFFIVSGLCIHLPQLRSNRINVAEFLIRRYVRVGLPLCAIWLLVSFLGTEAKEGLRSVAWSLYAEIFYYSLYPILWYARRLVSWPFLISLSALIAAPLSIIYYNSVPITMGWLAWIWGLPVWMSGCFMAEQLGKLHASNTSPAKTSLKPLRLTLLIASAIPMFLPHVGIGAGQPPAMLLLSALAWIWLFRELQCASGAWSWLERFGGASYSIYLVHNVALRSLGEYISQIPPEIGIAVRAFCIAIASYAFFRIVEAPSHRLARYGASLFNAKCSEGTVTAHAKH